MAILDATGKDVTWSHYGDKNRANEAFRASGEGRLQEHILNSQQQRSASTTPTQPGTSTPAPGQST